MMKKLTLLVLPPLMLASSLSAQVVGGDNVFEFLNLPVSPRITALGGQLISVRDDDVNLGYAAPSLLNPSMDGKLSFSHDFMLGGIAQGYAAYGHYLQPWDATLHAGLRYITYGDFDLTDETGEVLGSFDAAEYALTLGIGKQLYERLSVGANLKVVSSRLESYNAFGLLGDVSATFHDTTSQLNITLLLRHFGYQLSSYTPGNREPLPFEMQLGLSKRLEHLPFRFSIIYRYLDRWNILYDDPNSDETTFFLGEPAASSGNDFLDNLFRHFVFNGEFLFGKLDNFKVRFGYSHLRQRELTVRNLRSLAGFSFGFGLKIKRFRFDYGHSFYHLAGGQNHISVSTNLHSFRKRK